MPGYRVMTKTPTNVCTNILAIQDAGCLRRCTNLQKIRADAYL